MNFVFDNVIFSKERQGGISNYWFQLTKNFVVNNKAFFYEEKGGMENIFRQQLTIDNIIPHSNIPLPLARLLPIRYKSKAGPVLYHSSFYRKLISRSDVFEITTIHDFTHNRHAATLNRIAHNYLKYSSIGRAKGIICISNNTYRDLNRYCAPKKGQKTTVIYNGVSEDYKLLPQLSARDVSLLQKLGVTGKYLLFVGARSHYKNFSFCVQLLNELEDYQLVVAGNSFAENEWSVIDKQVAERIVVATSISNKELNILYNAAAALLYPSFYEGFGIPVIEAMKAGCPVLALNTSSIPEVANGAGILFEKLSVRCFTEAVRKLKNTDYRMAVVAAGVENARRFDWAKCYQETTAFYQEVCGLTF